MLIDSSFTLAPTTATSSADEFVDSASLAFPAYQSEVVIPAVGSPIGVGRPPAITMGVGSPPGRSTGLSTASVWNSVSRSPFLTPTKDRVNPLSTVAEILNWNSESTTKTTTTSSSSVDNNNNSSSSSGAGSSSVGNVAVQSSRFDAVKRENTVSVTPRSDLMSTSTVSTDALAKSSTSTAEVQESSSSRSFDPTRPLSSFGTRGPGCGVSQPCHGSTQSAGRSLWGGGWQTAALGPTSTQLSDGRTSDHCPPTVSISTAVRPRRQPLRLVLIKTVGTDNMWSAKPLPPSNQPARSRAAVNRPDRGSVCGSLSESALNDLSRWTELGSLRTVGREHLTAIRNTNLVSTAVTQCLFDHSFRCGC